MHTLSSHLCRILSSCSQPIRWIFHENFCVSLFWCLLVALLKLIVLVFRCLTHNFHVLFIPNTQLFFCVHSRCVFECWPRAGLVKRQSEFRKKNIWCSLHFFVDFSRLGLIEEKKIRIWLRNLAVVEKRERMNVSWVYNGQRKFELRWKILLKIEREI
jgi:hypothetical protein